MASSDRMSIEHSCGWLFLSFSPFALEVAIKTKIGKYKVYYEAFCGRLFKAAHFSYDQSESTQHNPRATFCGVFPPSIVSATSAKTRQRVMTNQMARNITHVRHCAVFPPSARVRPRLFPAKTETEKRNLINQTNLLTIQQQIIRHIKVKTYFLRFIKGLGLLHPSESNTKIQGLQRKQVQHLNEERDFDNY